ncbi:MAG: hypothetical protein ACXVA9_03230 [Bdellovibrionales bacterium]
MFQKISLLIITLGLFSGSAALAGTDNGIMQLLVGSVITAQPEWGNPCGRTSECLTNESCVNGICQANNGTGGCLGDYQCPVGERCIGNVCKTTITSNDGTSCANSFTTIQPMGCISSSECPFGGSCIHGKCVAPGGLGSCLSDVDCPVGEHCRKSVCSR